MNTKTAAPHSLLHFGLAVADVDKSLHFYESFGLKPEGSGSEILLRSGNGDDVIRLFGGTSKSLKYIALAAFPEDFDQIARQIREFGAPSVTPLFDTASKGIWTCDPDGNVILILPDAYVRNRQTRQAGPQIQSVGLHACPYQDTVQVDPLRLGHIFLFSKNFEAMARFYLNAIGFRISDISPGHVLFMHLPHGSDHHVIAFVNNGKKGSQNGRRSGRRRTKHGGPWVQPRLGIWTPSLGLEFFLLHPRSLGQFRRILLQHRFCPRRKRVEIP
jgi:catechol-2,3-dioxygenase